MCGGILPLNRHGQASRSRRLTPLLSGPHTAAASRGCDADDDMRLITHHTQTLSNAFLSQFSIHQSLCVQSRRGHFADNSLETEAQGSPNYVQQKQQITDVADYDIPPFNC